MPQLISYLPALGGVFGRAWQYFATANRRSKTTTKVGCQELIASLIPLNRSGVNQVAMDLLETAEFSRGPHFERHLEPIEIWELAGGTTGSQIMDWNSAVMISLAEIAIPFNPAAASVVEELRQERKHLRHHLRRMRWLEFHPTARVRVPQHLQRMAAVYSMMRIRLLVLYQVSHSGWYTALEAVL